MPTIARPMVRPMVGAMVKPLVGGGSGPPPPPAWATWDPDRANALCILSNGNTRLARTTSGSGWAVAISTAALTGKVYFEIEFDITDGGAADIGGAALAMGAGTTGTTFVGSTQAGTGAYPRQFDWLNYWDSSVSPYNVINHNQERDPLYRFGIAVDADTRDVWIQYITGTGAGTGWLGGGDPAAGTTPTRTLSGADPIYAAAGMSASSVSGTPYADLVADPAAFLMSAPAGFTAGIPV